MDKFKETIMINALETNPLTVTFDNIDQFFSTLSRQSQYEYKQKLTLILLNHEIQTMYTTTLFDYIIAIDLD